MGEIDIRQLVSPLDSQHALLSSTKPQRWKDLLTSKQGSCSACGGMNLLEMQRAEQDIELHQSPRHYCMRPKECSIRIESVVRNKVEVLCCSAFALVVLLTSCMHAYEQGQASDVGKRRDQDGRVIVRCWSQQLT